MVEDDGLPMAACGYDMQYTGRVYTFGCYGKSSFWCKESQTWQIHSDGRPRT